MFQDPMLDGLLQQVDINNQNLIKAEAAYRPDALDGLETLRQPLSRVAGAGGRVDCDQFVERGACRGGGRLCADLCPYR